MALARAMGRARKTKEIHAFNNYFMSEHLFVLNTREKAMNHRTQVPDFTKLMVSSGAKGINPYRDRV